MKRGIKERREGGAGKGEQRNTKEKQTVTAEERKRRDAITVRKKKERKNRIVKW